MENLYRKNEKGRYEKCGYDVKHQLNDGIWLIQSKPNSISTTSLVWRVGDLKQPADIVTRAALESFTDKLANYLMQLTDENSEEFKEAKKMFGGYIHGAVTYGNISASDLCSLFLRRIAQECEETTSPKSWADLLWEFRSKTNLHKTENFELKVKFLYELQEWLENSGYTIKL